MLGEQRGFADAPDAPDATDDAPPTRRRTDVLVLGAAGLTIAALLAVASQVLRAATYTNAPFGDRVLEFALSGPVVWTAFLLLVLAAVSLACLAPANASSALVVDLMRIVVGLVAAVAIVEFGYSAFVFATNAAIGHTRFTANFGPSTRVATTAGSASSLLLSAVALWFVAGRPGPRSALVEPIDPIDPVEPVDADDADEVSGFDDPDTEAPSWSAVGATAMLTALGALALFELLLEPLLRRPDAQLAAAFGGTSVTGRLEYAAGSYGLYPITLLAFAVVAMIVAARRRTVAQGVSTLAAGAMLGAVGVVAAAYSVYRVLDDHSGGGSTANIGRASMVTAALASAVVGALALMAALRFGQPERRDEARAPGSALQLPPAAVTRTGALVLTGSAVAVAIELVAAIAQHGGPSFRDAVVQLASVMLFGAIVALAAALLGRVSGGTGAGPVVVSLLLLVVGVGIVGCEAFAFVNVLWLHRDARSILPESTLQRHNLAALALACVLVGLAVLSLVVASDDVDDEDEMDPDAVLAPEPA
jgi:hypothetical protein